MQSLISRDECKLVQASFLQIEPIADKVAMAFYERLFELDPTLVRLFKTDMTLQGVKFMEKLAVAVMGLEDLDSIASLVESLGRKHVRHGVRRADYETARQALLWALQDSLGPAFSSELRDAWSAAFDTLSAGMLRAAEHDA